MEGETVGEDENGIPKLREVERKFSYCLRTWRNAHSDDDYHVNGEKRGGRERRRREREEQAVSREREKQEMDTISHLSDAAN